VFPYLTIDNEINTQLGSTMKKLLAMVALMAGFTSTKALAGYDANVLGTLTGVFVYTNGDYIYFKLDTQPSHPSCDSSYFVIAETVPLERRQMLLSRLLMAYASKERVNIGYDSQGDCASGYIRVHRVG